MMKRETVLLSTYNAVFIHEKSGDSLLIVTLIVGLSNCSMFCSTLLYFHSSFAIILMGKKELVAMVLFLPS